MFLICRKAVNTTNRNEASADARPNHLNWRCAVLLTLLACVIAPSPALGQDRFVSWEATPTAASDAASRIEANVVYGMHSGLALVMDVYYPRQPNGVGIIWISGSGFHAPEGYGARQLKLNYWTQAHTGPLIEAGFTVFAINHRAAPRFRYPAAIEDVQRAVRFIRHHADKFGIASDRIGAMGESSGGYLVALMGVLESAESPSTVDPVERESARIQAVVAMSALSDLTETFSSRVATILGSFMGRPCCRGGGPDEQLYRAASPRFHVDSGDPPTLLIHGDQDDVVPFAQSEAMLAALRAAGVPAKLIALPGAGHSYDAAPELPDFSAETIRWFAEHLGVVAR
jgi:acetyl esterase/lipase